MGRMDAMSELSGNPVPAEVINDYDGGEKLSYVDQSNRIGASLYEQMTGALGFDDLAASGKRILADQEWASKHLGDDLIDELSKMAAPHAMGKGTKRQFIKDALDVMAAYGDSFSGEKAAYFKEYRDWLIAGGPYYQRAVKTGVGQLAANLADNTIKSSFTVALGEPIEVALKLPALYRAEAAEGLSRWLANGEMFKKIPELEAKGFYGVERREITDPNLLAKLDNSWGGLNEKLGIPWKNLVYRTGEVRGGHEGGLKAVQDVLFIPRAMDMPRQRWYAQGRVESRFLSYTIGSINLGVDLMQRAVKGDMDAIIGIAIMTGGITAVGGPGSLVPQPFEALMKKANPDWENPLPKWGASGLVQQAGIGRVGLIYDMGSRQMQKMFTSSAKSLEGLSEGDMSAAAVNAAHAIMSAAIFTPSIAGDAQVQKAMGIARDLVLDDMDQDFGATVQKAYLPFTVNK